MNWDTEPATEKQLNYLKLFGYEPEQPLSKQAAHDLLNQFEEDPERCSIRNENRMRESAVYEQKRRENPAYYFHLDCDIAAKEYERAEKDGKRDAHEDLKIALRWRIDFWKETFDLSGRFEDSCPPPIYEFYNLFGRFMKIPKNSQIEGVLAALDKYSPTWDLDRPTDFFHTMKLNFPELMRQDVEEVQ